MSATPAVSPLKPSMILIALAIPLTAKIVKITETMLKLSNQSNPHILIEFKDVPVIPQPKNPEAMVASSRVLTETFLVISSNKPKIKAGIPAIKIVLRICRFSAASGLWLEKAYPARTPTTSAIPAMRGVGVVWNFCTPMLVSIEKTPCHFFVLTNSRQVNKEASAAINASRRASSRGEKLLKSIGDCVLLCTRMDCGTMQSLFDLIVPRDIDGRKL